MPVSTHRRPRTPRRLWADLSLRAKGVFVVSLPVLALAAVIATFSLAQRREEAADQASQRAADVRTTVRSLLVSLLDLETGVRGFLITRDLRFLDPYREARQEI